MQSEVHKLREFLDRFESTDILYVIVGESVPSLLKGVDSDVDIVVGSNMLSSFHSIIKKIGSDLSLQLVQVLQHERCAFYYVVTWLEAGQRHYLKLDICSDYVRYGRKLLTAEEMLRGRERDASGTFFIPNSGNNFVYYLLKKIDKGSIDQQQFSFLRSLYEPERDRAKEMIHRFWGREDADTIAQDLEHGDLEHFRLGIPVWQAALRKSVKRSVMDGVQETRRRLLRMIRPTGVWIAVLGPDGCGKSSVINRLLPALEPAFRRTGLLHFRPKVGYRGPADDTHSADPHNQPDRSWIGSVLKLGYYAADYIFGYVLMILPARIRSTFLVFDRYYDDLLVDRKRYCYGGPKGLLRFVRWFIPKPDLVFCLDAPADVLQARKQEVPFEVTARQREAYRDLVSALPHGHVIDASQPLERVVADVETQIVSFMERRLAARMRGNCGK